MSVYPRYTTPDIDYALHLTSTAFAQEKEKEGGVSSTDSSGNRQFVSKVAGRMLGLWLHPYMVQMEPQFWQG